MRPLLLLLPLVAACAPQPPAGPVPAAATPAAPTPPVPATCNDGPAQFAVGQPHGGRLADDARRRSGARIVRTVRPGEIVTMEFNGERLTLQLDSAQRVQAARCG